MHSGGASSPKRPPYGIRAAAVYLRGKLPLEALNRHRLLTCTSKVAGKLPFLENHLVVRLGDIGEIEVRLGHKEGRLAGFDLFSGMS